MYVAKYLYFKISITVQTTSIIKVRFFVGIFSTQRLAHTYQNIDM